MLGEGSELFFERVRGLFLDPSALLEGTMMTRAMLMMNRVASLRVFLGATLVLGLAQAGAVQAASYSDMADPNGTVFYENISDINGLYGAPTVSLNSLDFTPADFTAQCSLCPGGSTTSDTITLDIRATAGQQISELSVNEGLNYNIQSFSPTGFASILAESTIFIDILEVDGQSVNNINASVQMAFTPTGSASVFGFSSDSGIIIGATGGIDIAQILAGAGAAGGEATLVRISLDNTLTAFHDGTGGQAFIRKRDTDFLSITVNGGPNVPEPSTAILLLSGLALLSGRRKTSA